MCGIVGKLYFSGARQVDPELIKKMADTIKYRGPDDEGHFCQGQIGLGHRRLSIIDLSPAGHQPMSNTDATIWIVYNGEIYNFQELKIKLRKLGYKFNSNSDTEVIIHLYEEYGEKCLEHLRGMFAFAIWDSKKHKLFIARDRVGKKPLKYYLGKDFIVFGSELKVFLIDPEVPREPDYIAIHHYLSFQYVPNPLTGFKGIKKLPPAHYLIVENGKVRIERYWRLDFSKKLKLSENEWQKEIMERLEKAVKLRLVSDVPLGAFLSGGVDSSAIVGLMAKNSNQPVKTFTIGFKEQSHNELPYARQIANLFKTDHTEFIVEPKALEILPELIYHYEEPYADSSAIPTYYVSKLTREHVTVVLNGDGGDENFAGYKWYNIQKFASYYDYVPRWLRESVIRQGASLNNKIFKSTLSDRVLRFNDTFSEGKFRRYLEYIVYFNEKSKHALYTQDFQSRVGEADSRDIIENKFMQAGTTDIIDQALSVDFNSFLPDDLLVKVDIASMAVSLEGRSPLLDHEFLEFTANIPSSLKLKGQKNKYIFKKALEGLLPNEILYRKKMGFSVPIEHWFRHELKDYIRESLLNPRARARNIFNPESINNLIISHQNTKLDQSRKLWALLTLELWFQTFFDTAKVTQ
ncbi:MAG: asparagine synthase (glutamine-hydrolyzing) [Patescibacteria group bacterium]|jgi:asparagine synthase (glutamine-hydrolysing)